MSQQVLSRKSRFSVGQLLSCQYPVNGSKNILKNHTGVIVDIGRSANGPFVTIEEVRGQEYRTLLYKKMYRPRIIK